MNRGNKRLANKNAQTNKILYLLSLAAPIARALEAKEALQSTAFAFDLVERRLVVHDAHLCPVAKVVNVPLVALQLCCEHLTAGPDKRYNNNKVARLDLHAQVARLLPILEKSLDGRNVEVTLRCRRHLHCENLTHDTGTRVHEKKKGRKEAHVRQMRRTDTQLGERKTLNCEAATGNLTLPPYHRLTEVAASHGSQCPCKPLTCTTRRCSSPLRSKNCRKSKPFSLLLGGKIHEPA